MKPDSDLFLLLDMIRSAEVDERSFDDYIQEGLRIFHKGQTDLEEIIEFFCELTLNKLEISSEEVRNETKRFLKEYFYSVPEFRTQLENICKNLTEIKD